jgi:diguanylate cyclase (GGDEF)-like protein
LKDTANLLRECFRESDILARLGGDEFAIFIAEADEVEIARRIQERLSAYRRRSERRYRLSFSMGVVGCGESDADDIEALLKQADGLMYQQKRKNRSSRRQQHTKAKTAGSHHRAG